MSYYDVRLAEIARKRRASEEAAETRRRAIVVQAEAVTNAKAALRSQAETLNAMWEAAWREFEPTFRAWQVEYGRDFNEWYTARVADTYAPEPT